MKHLNLFKSSRIKNKYINSANELFDDKALKAEHEIDYLKKNIIQKFQEAQVSDELYDALNSVHSNDRIIILWLGCCFWMYLG